MWQARSYRIYLVSSHPPISSKSHYAISNKASFRVNRLRNLRISSYSFARVSSEKMEFVGETLMIPPTFANKPRTIGQDRIVQIEVLLAFRCNIITLVPDEASLPGL